MSYIIKNWGIVMERNTKNLLLVFGNSIGVIATIIINALAVILPLNGKSTSELSDAIPNLFVPAGITFSIWSIIYIFLIVFILYQMVDLAKKQSDTNYLEKIGGWFMLASVGNIIWIFLWHYEYVTYSLLAMLLLFVSLLITYLKLDIGLSKVPLKEKLAIHATISIYLGWITVATIANVTAVLVKLDVGELVLGQATWTILVIVVAALITILMLIQRRDIAYSLVIMWALLGIIIKRLNTEPVHNSIVYTAAISIIIIFCVMIVKTLWDNKKVKVSS